MTTEPTDAGHVVEIQYSASPEATRIEPPVWQQLLNGWAPTITQVTIVPGAGGRFEVSLDGELIFSKLALKRHATPGEVHAARRERLGPPSTAEPFHCEVSAGPGTPRRVTDREARRPTVLPATATR